MAYKFYEYYFYIISESKKSLVNHSDNDDNIEEIPFDESKLEKKKLQGKTRSRIAISEEVFGCFNKKETIQLKRVFKS